MKEEVAIISAEKKFVLDENNEFTDKIKGKSVFRNPVNFDREPQFLAIFIKGEKSLQVIAEIDSEKSDLRNGEIWMKNAIPVTIPIRFGKDKLEGIRYTTFRKLVTHKTTDYLK
jgi:hypothetical protein